MQASQTYTPGLEEVFYNAQAGFTLQPMLLFASILPRDDEATIKRKWQLAAIYLDILLTRRIWNYRTTDQSTMKYPIFQVMLAIRGLTPEALSLKLKEELDGETETFASNERFALHGMNRKQIARILARMTDFVERSSCMASRYLEYTTGSGKKRGPWCKEVDVAGFQRSRGRPGLLHHRGRILDSRVGLEWEDGSGSVPQTSRAAAAIFLRSFKRSGR